MRRSTASMCITCALRHAAQGFRGHSGRDGGVGRAIRSCRRIHRQRPVDVINGRFIYPDGVAASIIGAPWHPGRADGTGHRHRRLLARAIQSPQIRWALNRAAHVTAVSPSLADRILELGTAASKVSSSVNGIDLERFRPDGPSLLRERCGLDPEQKDPGDPGACPARRGSVFSRRAGQAPAASGRCDFHTVIIGDGPERKALRSRRRAFGLNSAPTFAGEIDHWRCPPCSRGRTPSACPACARGTPNVVIEALATGVPVVATQVGGTPLLIGDHNGRLVPRGAGRPLAQAIADVISRAMGSGEHPPFRGAHVLASRGSPVMPSSHSLCRMERLPSPTTRGSGSHESGVRAVLTQWIRRRLLARWVVCREARAGGEVALTFDDGPHPEVTPAVLTCWIATAHVRPSSASARSSARNTRTGRGETPPRP